MGVDEHLTSRLKPKPSFDDLKLPSDFAKPRDLPRPPARPKVNDLHELRSEIRRLNSSIGELLQVFSRAHEDIKAEPTADLSKKLDKLIEQNEEIGRALLLLLELHREHLPQISRHTRVSSELKLRRPPAQLFSNSRK